MKSSSSRQQQGGAWNPWSTERLEKLKLRQYGAKGTHESEVGWGGGKGQIRKDCEPAKVGFQRNQGFSQRAVRNHWRVLSRKVNYLI